MLSTNPEQGLNLRFKALIQAAPVPLLVVLRLQSSLHTIPHLLAVAQTVPFPFPCPPGQSYSSNKIQLSITASEARPSPVTPVEPHLPVAEGLFTCLPPRLLCGSLRTKSLPYLSPVLKGPGQTSIHTGSSCVKQEKGARHHLRHLQGQEDQRRCPTPLIYSWTK